MQNNHWKYEIGSNWTSGYVSGPTFEVALKKVQKIMKEETKGVPGERWIKSLVFSSQAES